MFKFLKKSTDLIKPCAKIRVSDKGMVSIPSQELISLPEIKDMQQKASIIVSKSNTDFKEQIEYTKSIAKDLGILDQADKAADPELQKLLSGEGEYLFRAGWLLGYVKGNEDD